MKFSIFLAIVLGTVMVTIHTGQGFAQDSTCNPHTVCAHPGDMLTYNIILRDINSSQTYSFGDMVDANNIKMIQSQKDTSGIQNATLVLNLKTGFVHSQQDTSTAKPFLEILASPIDYNKSDMSITPLVTDFNGFKRTSLVAFHSNENSTSKIVYDMETGILLEEHSSTIIEINGNPEVVDFSDKLIGTNMISSDSQTIKGSGNISIPKWVKNTAGMWANGTSSDGEFTNAIQFLISNKIMSIPHGASGASSSHSIPTWLKHSTQMWANGQITDNEFVQSIQWLITKGIVQVGN